MDNTTSYYYHMFQVDFFWDKIREKLCKDNPKARVQLRYIKKLIGTAVESKVLGTQSLCGLARAFENVAAQCEGGSALFGTHISIKNSEAVKGTLQDLAPFFRYDSQYDLQTQYLYKLRGLNEVQFFIKGDGAWTGLHGEDCQLDSFNINLGPGDSKWVFIPEREHERISTALISELKADSDFDIRLNWHTFWLSEQWLTEKEIAFEVAVQRPGFAVYVPGGSLHQVVNVGSGLNIAWNLAPFTMQTIQRLIEGFKFETSCFKRVPMVPVLRMLHITLVKHYTAFSLTELRIISYFLKRYFNVEQEKHASIAQRAIKMEVYGFEVKGASLAVNNCDACQRAFYLRAYRLLAKSTASQLCTDCILSRKDIDQLEVANLVDALRTKQLLDLLTEPFPHFVPSEEKFLHCNYLAQGCRTLTRLDQKRPGQLNVEIAKCFNKADFKRQEISRVQKSIMDCELALTRSKSQTHRHQLQRAIEKRSKKLEELKRCKIT